MKRERLDYFFRTYVSFSVFSLCLLPSVGLAFDLSSVYERGTQSLSQIKGAANEMFHDNLTFDDAAVNREVKPLLTSLRDTQRKRVNRINELMRTNRPLAIDLEQQEARRYCTILPIEITLQEQIEENCQTLKIKNTCDSLALSTVIPLTNRAKSKVAEISADLSIRNILELERELVADFRAVQKANLTCSNLYKSALLDNSCKNTYKNFFTTFKNDFVQNCSESSVIEALERFVVNMRSFDHSSRIDLAEALAIHSQSRAAEINLARTIEQIDATRLTLERAAGKGSRIDNRQPAEQSVQLENYQGS